MRPTALVLNIVVAAFTSFRFLRAGQFNGRLLLPFIAASLPLAFLGGQIHLPSAIYKPLVGVVLLLAALRLLWPKEIAALKAVRPPPLWASLASGGAIGILSGLTGTGGGIFLSPLILFFGWEEPRKTSGIAAVFILANSISGLAGNVSSVGALPPELPYFVTAAIGGAIIGTSLGISRFASKTLLRVLGVVLVIAGLKLMLT